MHDTTDALSDWLDEGLKKIRRVAPDDKVQRQGRFIEVLQQENGSLRDAIQAFTDKTLKAQRVAPLVSLQELHKSHETQLDQLPSQGQNLQW